MIDKIKENWEKILLILREEYGDQITDISYKTWLEPLKPYSFKGNTITIIVPVSYTHLTLPTNREV